MVNPPLVPTLFERVDGRGLVLRVEREALFGPIAANSHALHLACDAGVEAVFPLPTGLPVQIGVVGVGTVEAHLFDDFGVGG